MESPLRAEPGLGLIETLAWDGLRLARVDLHLARLAASSARLDWPCDTGAARAALEAAVPAGPARMRLLSEGGRFTVTAAPLPPVRAEWRVAVSSHRLCPDDPWLGVKSTRRTLYDRTRAGLPGGVEEIIFLNTRAEACEGTITNLFFDAGEGLRTPPLASGLLPGILRQVLIAEGCREQVLPAADLEKVRLFVGNSLRGLIPARHVRV